MSRKFTTLIAEDDEISFELYKARLKNFNLEIIHASNGKIAVEKVKENQHIDLILMDIRMPILNGYEATKQIRTINASVPIIAQTAFAAIPEHQKILEMGFTEFFAKPLDEGILGTLINKYKSSN
jgi:CheY-like chemotaxis protein